MGGYLAEPSDELSVYFTTKHIFERNYVMWLGAADLEQEGICMICFFFCWTFLTIPEYSAILFRHLYLFNLSSSHWACVLLLFVMTKNL